METSGGYHYGHYLNTEKAAEYLALSPNTLRQYVSRGKIPFIKVPGSNQVRFRREDLDKWMMQGFRAASNVADGK